MVESLPPPPGADVSRTFGPCSKCTSFDVHVGWHRSEYDCTYRQQELMRAIALAKEEHLHAVCRRCGYGWPERVGAMKDG